MNKKKLQNTIEKIKKSNEIFDKKKTGIIITDPEVFYSPRITYISIYLQTKNQALIQKIISEFEKNNEVKIDSYNIDYYLYSYELQLFLI